ncbi:MAG: energy transducer TonB [Salinivirgaceae bacterium]|nr:energy transducer TonB [Salinivirgaceae bacterium]
MKKQLNKLAKSSALVIIALAAICTTGYAQSNDLSAGDSQNSTTLTKENVGAGITMPEFPGGDVGLSKYLAENVKFPENAKKDSLSRKVFVQFVINQEGDVENVKVVRGVDKAFDKEAIRVVENMPKWEPAKQFGKPVKFTHTIAVAFK